MQPSGLRRTQLDRLLIGLKRPAQGSWIRQIREALGMSATDLARRMGVAQQRISRLEKDENELKISLETLSRAAEALNCEVVYYLVPKTSLEETVKGQALKAAKKLARQVDVTMSLEKQKTSKVAREKLIQEMAADLIRRSDRKIWEVD